jgi:hypothetical protein
MSHSQVMTVYGLVVYGLVVRSVINAASEGYIIGARHTVIVHMP